MTKKKKKKNTQKTLDNMKRHNLRIIGIEENENTWHQDPENIFNIITRENFLNVKKQMLINIQQTDKTQIILDQKRKFFQHIIIKTQNLQNRERLLKLVGGKAR